MPIYEYQCSVCNHQIEVYQNISDPVLKECPECKKRKLKKLVSAASFHLKGEGWYVTDFKDKPQDKNKLVEKTDKSESTESVGSADKKTKEESTTKAKGEKASATKAKTAKDKTTSTKSE